MRAVVDTNILVSGLMATGGPPGQVVDAIITGTLRLAVCAEVLDEYRLVLPRPRLSIRIDRIAGLLQLIEQTADWLSVPPYAGQPPLPDPTDWPFVACALAADCPLITGNLKHFPATLGVRVMTAREWADCGQQKSG